MNSLIRHEDDVFRVLSIDEIYRGPGTGRIVPNLKSMVIDENVGIYFVRSINEDPENPVAALNLAMRFNNSSSFNADNDSLITAFSIYDPSAATVILVDDTVSPPTATVDERWRSFVNPTHGMLYLGTDTSIENGAVISALYNASGNFSSNEIPYEVVDPAAPNIKRPKTFNLTQLPANGEVVTLVDVNQEGDVVGKRPFVIEYSSFIRPSNASDVQLTGFSLKSVLMDPQDASVVLNPINTPLDTSTFSLELIYSDGSKVPNIPIDGVKAVMHGVDNFNTSQAGVPYNLGVSYYPDAGEPFISLTPGVRKHITKNYSIRNVVKETSFSLKLFCVPRFVSTISGYALSWYLTNLERDILVDVTDSVTAIVSNFNGAAFNGKRYGDKQTIDATIVLDDVIPGVYPGHIHTQRLDIVLNVPGTTESSPWEIDYIMDGNYILGRDERASCSNVGKPTLNLSNGYDSFNKWLFELYNLSAPLFDPDVESTEPDPTHFVVRYKNAELEVPIGSWEDNIEMPDGSPDFVQNETIELVWVTKTGSGDLYHAVTGLMIHLDL